MDSKSNDKSAQEQTSRLQLFLEKGVVIGDPMALAGLAEQVEESAVPIDGVPYDTKRTTGEKVDCALCGRSRNHFKGFIVDFEGGIRAAVGIECAEDKLFASGAWEEMAARAERRKLQALYEERSAPTIALIDQLLPVLKRCADTAAIIDSFLHKVYEELPDLYFGIARAGERDGKLKREMARTITIKGRDGIERQVEDYYDKTFATVPSKPFESGGLAGSINAISRALLKAKKLLDAEGITMAQQAEAFRKIRILRQDMNDAQAACEDSLSLLSMDFWESVCKWGRADSLRDGNFRTKKRLVRHSDSEEIFGEVSVPAPVSLTSFTQAIEQWPRL